MKPAIHFLAALLLVCAMCECALARGGGGCLEEGTLVATPDGPRPVEQFAAGDRLWAVVGGKLIEAKVAAVLSLRPDNYVQIDCGSARLRVTAGHPLQTGEGEFIEAAHARPGQQLYIRSADGLRAINVDSVQTVPADRPAFNLMVRPGGTFLANDFVVHNKGCFLPDTPILLSNGDEKPISEIRPGDKVRAFATNGASTEAEVSEIITHEVDEYFVVTLNSAILRVTAEHPFYVGAGRFRTLECLRTGDSVYAFDGAALSAQKICGIERIAQHVRVYNLQTDSPHTFFASRIAVHNKGGGGCFPAGTQITTPKGDELIEKVQVGQIVTAVGRDGRPTVARVLAVHRARSCLLSINTDGGMLRTTDEHPLLLPTGEYRQSASLAAGDAVMMLVNGQAQSVQVRGLSRGEAQTDVFNLTVESPNTFVADGFIVHNKGGGCFPAGTSILTADGPVAIERIVVGQVVRAMDESGCVRDARVRAMYLNRSALLTVRTDHGEVRTTDEHPLRLADGRYRQAGALAAGDRITIVEDNEPRPATVLELIGGTEEVEVYNLSVDDPHTFIADGFVVHNKGGSFGGSRRSSSSSRSRSTTGPLSGASGSLVCLAVALLTIGPFVVVAIKGKKIVAFLRGKGGGEELDYIHSPAAVEPKAAKTEKLLAYLARQDSSVSPDSLRDTAGETFLKLQQCWQTREYQPMQSLLMADLYEDHCNQLKGMKRTHEINKIAALKVERVELVHVRYTSDSEMREFTALITASAIDHYIDDRTGAFLRGDRSPARFQEFWTFQLRGGHWLLREIEQSRESDKLKEENIAETLNPEEFRAICAPSGAAPAAVGKASRPDRILAALGQRNPMWEKAALIERVRHVFLNVMLTRQSGEPGRIRTDLIFPDLAAAIIEENRKRLREGESIEFRNLCVRKVDLMLIRNYGTEQRDEFTARITAHAQRIARRREKIIGQDQDVTAFTEYWTFGRHDGQWKVKESLSEAAGAKIAAQLPEQPGDV